MRFGQIEMGWRKYKNDMEEIYIYYMRRIPKGIEDEMKDCRCDEDARRIEYDENENIKIKFYKDYRNWNEMEIRSALLWQQALFSRCKWPEYKLKNK